VKRSAEKAGEKTKEAAETVGEKTKEAAVAVGSKTRELWRKTKAYLSEDRETYREGARQKLDELSKEIADLKSRKSEAADRKSFEDKLDSLSRQHATAEKQLADLKKASDEKEYKEARKEFNKTVDAMEDNLADARKQLRG